MISLVSDSGQVLDYDGQSFSFSRQVASFIDFKIKGDFSVNFTLSGNSYNRSVLGYYGPLQQGNPAYSKQRFTVTNDGNPTVRGYIVIQAEDSNGDLECFFLSGNANWFNAMQFKIKDIDFESEVITYDQVDARKAATSGIIFPIVDWAYNGYKLSTTFLSHSNTLEGVYEMFPCYYLHSLVEAVAVKSNIKIAGTLTNDELYKSIIITPDGPDLAWPDSAIFYTWVTRSANVAQAYPAADKLKFDTTQETDGQYDTTNFRFTAKRTATYEIIVNANMSVNQDYTFTIYKNGSGSGISLFTSTSSLNGTTTINLAKGDYIELFSVASTSAYNLLAGSSWRINIRKSIESYNTYGTICYVTPAAVIPDIKAIDLIKFLTFYFGCICTFDEYSQTLTLNKISLYDKLNALDLTENYVSHSINYNTGATKNNIIQFQDGNEDEIISYNRQNIVSYGGGNITTSFTIDQSNREIYNLPFAPSWDRPNRSQIGWFMPFIKFYDLKDSENTADQATVTSVSSSGGNARFNCTNTFNQASSELYRINTNYYVGYAFSTNVTSTYIEFFDVAFNKTATGNIYKQDVSKVSGTNRLLICRPGTNVSDAGGPASFYFIASSGTSTSSTAAVAWFDKPKLGQNIDSNLASLAIDPVLGRTYNNTVSNLYWGYLKNAFNRPIIEAYLHIHEEVYQNIDFSRFIYLKTKDLQGYFFVMKIENYQDSSIPTKCSLMWVD